jgi:hypothetical protein
MVFLYFDLKWVFYFNSSRIKCTSITSGLVFHHYYYSPFACTTIKAVHIEHRQLIQTDEVFTFSRKFLMRLWSSCGFLHSVAIKCSDVLVKCTASIFSVTEPVHIDDDVIWRKKSVSYIKWFEGVCSITATEGKKTG